MSEQGGNDPFDVLFETTLDDDVFRALRDRQRRLALYYLQEVESTTLDELVDVVTGWCHADRDRMASRADRERVALAMHHRHLPRLVDADLVRHDEASGLVERSPPSNAERALVELAFRWEFGTE